jgi:L-threonylcarbamoyladenylate synthase
VLAPDGPWLEAANRASEVLRSGGVALLPAEGVYGLHARAEDSAAVERLLTMKPRQGKKGWIGLIADPGDAGRWAETDPRAEALIRSHWPGALTLVLRAKPAIPAAMRNDDGTIALRCPGSDFLRAVVRNATGLVISTSANEPGAPPRVRPEGFPSEIVDLVVDQGTLSGTPSTVVLIQTDGVTVLREGAIRIDES